jgi:hypothetical protein
LAINSLPDEVLLEIFVFYRQGIDLYDYRWRKKYVWFNLAHVCRKWRAVMFASFSRLDLGITVGPQRPSHVNSILSGPLPILVEYTGVHSDRDLTGSEFRHMLIAFGRRHRDRVREISFEGTSANFNKFFEVTNCPFPVLESLVLNFKAGFELKLPDAFLRGPNLPDLHLRRLRFRRALFASVSGFLSSATALTDLSLEIDTVFGPSPETSFLACLQGMPCLRSLNLSIPKSESSKLFGSLLRPSTPEDIVPLSNLTCFHYVGHPIFLSALLAGFSALSLQDVDFSFSDSILSPIVHLPRFITEIEEHYHIAQVNITKCEISLSLLAHSESTNHCKPHFKLHDPGRLPESIMQMSSALSTRLTTIEELRVIFDWSPAGASDNVVPWLRILQHFPGIRALRLDSTRYDYMARSLDQGREESNDLVLLPALEEIRLGKNFRFTDEIQCVYQLAAFEPFVSTRQQAGRPVKVFFGQ